MKNVFIHDSAVIYDDVVIGDNVYIGPNCIIGENSYQLKSNTIKKTIIGNNCKILGGSIICRGAELCGNNRVDHMSYIGENTTIGIDSVIEYGARVYERVSIGKKTFISGFVCNDSIIGNSCVIQGDLIHRFVDVIPDINEIAPTIESYVFVGRSSQIIGPITLKERSYIAAGSIIAFSTKEGKLYMGAPAEIKGDAPLFFKQTDTI